MESESRDELTFSLHPEMLDEGSAEEKAGFGTIKVMAKGRCTGVHRPYPLLEKAKNRCARAEKGRLTRTATHSSSISIRRADEFLQRAQPVVSVDTKKKELVGDFKNAGREWQPKGQPEKSMVHDFPQDATGKAIPYGIYDMGRNEAWVSVGCDHDTPAFAVASLRRWWEGMGKSRYPEARELFITADAGGSNGHRSRTWKHELQRFADEAGVRIHVSHFPPGTSKWNKIEHRLFCHITHNWRGKPLRTFETVVDLIGNTRTRARLRVRAELDKRQYPKE